VIRRAMQEYVFSRFYCHLRCSFALQARGWVADAFCLGLRSFCLMLVLLLLLSTKAVHQHNRLPVAQGNPRS